MIFIEKPSEFAPKFEVTSCFCEFDGKILLLLRQDHKPQGNTYGIPAGKIDEGETPLAAMRREMNEEIALDLPESAFTRLHTVFVRYPTYDFPYHMYKVALDEQMVSRIQLNLDEHKSMIWRTPSEALREPLIPDEDACIKLCYQVC